MTERLPGATLTDLRYRGRLPTALLIFGPAFVTSVAYMDPGNFATNFAAGAEHGYLLVWVIVMSNLMAMVVQYLSSKLGLATGRNLPEMCRARFGRRTNLLLWVQAEAIAMATDLAEFVGAALALYLLFGVPPLYAGLITAVVAFGVLALEQQGYRRFEVAIVALLAVLAAGFVYLFFAAGGQDYGAFAEGLVPGLDGTGSLGLTVGIIGATVMPHAIYLHSALPTNRVPAVGPHERRILLNYNKWDCIIGLGVAGLVNLSMLCIAAAVLHGEPGAETGDLVEVHENLGALIGGGAALAFAVALLASGFASSSVGTYAGQVVMAGFTGWRIPLVVRRLFTMLPSLVVLALGVSASQALVFSQIVLSFGISFALVPLVLFTRDARIMSELVNARSTTVVAALIALVISGLNVFLVVAAVAGLA